MKLAIVQKSISKTDLRPYLDLARDMKAELVCFGELATTGCLYEPREVPPPETVLDLLAPYDFRAMVGLPYATENGLYNTYLYYHRGWSRMYHKINLFPPFNEPEIFTAGPVPGVWETDFGRLGVAICYDIRFPQVFEELRARQVEKIFIPAAFPRERVDDYRSLLVERARQTGAWVIGINAVGSDERQEYGGCSSVIEPDGSVAVQADETGETILEIDI